MSTKDQARASRLTWIWIAVIAVIAIAIAVFGRHHPGTIDTPGTHTAQGVPQAAVGAQPSSVS